MKASVTFLRLGATPLHRLAQGTAGLAAVAMLVLGTTMTPLASAQLAPGTTGLDTSGDAKKELAACNSGKTAQNRATCVLEVRRAQAAKHSGKLQNYGDFQANALRRCEVFKDALDLKACRERILNPTVEGSVAEGGILREAQVVVTLPPSTPPGSTRAPTSTTAPGTSTTPDTPVTPAPDSMSSPDSPMAPGSTMSPGSSQTMPETTPPPATR